MVHTLLEAQAEEPLQLSGCAPRPWLSRGMRALAPQSPAVHCISRLVSANVDRLGYLWRLEGEQPLVSKARDVLNFYPITPLYISMYVTACLIYLSVTRGWRLDSLGMENE